MSQFNVEPGDYYNTGKVMPKGFGIVATEHKIDII